MFIVSEAKHEKYVRVGDNLETKVEISLEEALAGPIRHKLVRGLGEKAGWMEVQVPENFAKAGAQTVVPGAGMPIRKEGKVVGNGDLIVKCVSRSAFLDRLTDPFCFTDTTFNSPPGWLPIKGITGAVSFRKPEPLLRRVFLICSPLGIESFIYLARFFVILLIVFLLAFHLFPGSLHQ